MQVEIYNDGGPWYVRVEGENRARSAHRMLVGAVMAGEILARELHAELRVINVDGSDEVLPVKPGPAYRQ